jgi:hypothetical protein
MKPFWKSKINWISLVTVILGFLTDPQITDFVDPWWAAQMLKGAGLLTFIIRTWFTQDQITL